MTLFFRQWWMFDVAGVIVIVGSVIVDVIVTDTVVVTSVTSNQLHVYQNLTMVVHHYKEEHITCQNSTMVVYSYWSSDVSTGNFG
jgi:hypothetical protein